MLGHYIPIRQYHWSGHGTSGRRSGNGFGDGGGNGDGDQAPEDYKVENRNMSVQPWSLTC